MYFNDMVLFTKNVSLKFSLI